jgi:hypothetical protein
MLGCCGRLVITEMRWLASDLCDVVYAVVMHDVLCMALPYFLSLHPLTPLCWSFDHIVPSTRFFCDALRGVF